MDVIRDKRLQSEMAAFFARLKFLEEAEADLLLLQKTTFLPYVNRALDHAAMVLTTKWHAAYDLFMNYSDIMTRVDRMKSLIEESFGRP
jgi:hypothetical protein